MTPYTEMAQMWRRQDCNPPTFSVSLLFSPKKHSLIIRVVADCKCT